jgi:hypothetical protein
VAKSDYVRPDHETTHGTTISISNVYMQGGTQTLDGFEWEDVTFIGTRIRYAGGRVKLTKVHFINCTFDVPSTPHGAQVADYAALLSASLTIG